MPLPLISLTFSSSTWIKFREFTTYMGFFFVFVFLLLTTVPLPPVKAYIMLKKKKPQILKPEVDPDEDQKKKPYKTWTKLHRLTWNTIRKIPLSFLNEIGCFLGQHSTKLEEKLRYSFPVRHTLSKRKCRYRFK